MLHLRVINQLQPLLFLLEQFKKISSFDFFVDFFCWESLDCENPYIIRYSSKFDLMTGLGIVMKSRSASKKSRLRLGELSYYWCRCNRDRESL